MMESKILAVLLPQFTHWGYYIIILITFLETSAFLGLLVPGETVVVMAGLLVTRGVLELGDVICAASLGAIMGDTVGYFIGRRFGKEFFLKYGHYFLFKKEYLDEAKDFFDKHGGKAVFLGRFMAWLRSFAPVVAGILKMPYQKFLLFNVPGGIAWAITFSLLGYLVGNSWDIIRTYLGRLGILAFISGGVAIYLYFLITRKRRVIEARVGWIDKRLSFLMPGTWEFVKDRFRAGRWYGLNLTIALMLCIVAIFSFGEIVEDLVDKETLFYLDFRIQGLVEAIISPGVTRFMVDITSLGGIYTISITIGIIFAYLLHRKDWWNLFSLFLVAGLGQILLVLLKFFFHRPRPIQQLAMAHGYSFPSGHAFTAMIVYGFLIYITWKLIKSEVLRFVIFSLSAIVIILVGISRIYLNVHWLTDVLGGYAAGFSWL
ncbi:MAG TPA: bifunctional DedA family/phosphatase PAP2 family protein, partial [Desulfatiglandales bacterium]|nr:bifunctional DedA family/phosphatase PAP2 family protein [Desulfatiglandales bacterium]